MINWTKQMPQIKKLETNFLNIFQHKLSVEGYAVERSCVQKPPGSFCWIGNFGEEEW